MIKLLSGSALAVAAALLLPMSVSAQDMICYDTPDGRVCGDHVPPEHARFDRIILNEQGVVIRREQGEITAEEQAAIDEQMRLEQERLREAEERRRYGQMLLDSYTSVEAIEAVRDRRLEAIDGQSAVIELYLDNLHTKLIDLERRAQRFSPFSDEKDAPPLPVNLATDIERTNASIERLRERLEASYRQYTETEAGFQQDIDYFRQLMGVGA